MIAAWPRLAHSAGPYVGLGLGANFEHDATVNDNSHPIGTLEYDSGPLGLIGVGYGFALGLRPELELGYRQNSVDGMRAVASGASGDQHTSTVLANLWYDLPLPLPVVRPYIGGGAGMARVDFRDFTNAHNNHRDAGDDVFAWQLGAGVAWDISRRFAVSLGYRYLHTNEGKYHLDPVNAGEIADGVLLGVRANLGPVPGEPVAVNFEPPPPPAEAAALETVVLRPVNFKFDHSDLTDAARQTLDELAAELRAYPDLRVTIEGHTDSIGSVEYNMGLGMRRATSVRDHLVDAGVDPSRLEVKSFGESEPVVTNRTRDGRAMNRHASFDTTEETHGVRVVVEPSNPETEKAAHGPEDPVQDRQPPAEPDRPR